MRTAHHIARTSITDRSRITVILAIALTGLLLSGCVSITTGGDGSDGAEDEYQKHAFQVGENPTVDITGFNGSIEIVIGDDGIVDVEAKLTIPNRVSYSAALDGNTVTVIAKKTGSGITFGRSPRAEIKVIVPKHSTIKARTSNGAVDVTGVNGPGDLETSNGRITVSGVEGRFEVDTSNGTITMSDVDGQFRAHTTNGNINFSGFLAGGSDNSFTTSNGSIEVTFKGEPDVEIDARTSNGTAKSDRPILATTTEKTRLVGKYGTGSATLELRTSNGSIIIR
ncbi:MAG: DUF4097 family beta strand repeat protein [Chloroflexi bacterium]|nr:DUF4097 family beta strand repeat protein [Chloroflexota bacterium]